MSVEAGIVALIRQDSGIQSCPTHGRLHPLVLPEDGPKPSTTFQRITTRTLNALDGSLDVTQIRLQVDHWAETYGDVRSASDAYDALLDGFSGILPDGTTVFGISIDTCKDLFEQEARLYRVSTDYLIQFAR